MNASVASQKQKTRKAFMRIKESKWGTSCKSMWIKHPWNTSHIPYSDLAKTLFPVENRNNVKIKITHHRVIERDAFGKEFNWMLADSVSQCSIKFFVQLIVGPLSCDVRDIWSIKSEIKGLKFRRIPFVTSPKRFLS